MRATTHSVTDGQTDGQQAAGNSRSYCATVRSAKNTLMEFGKRHDAPDTADFCPRQLVTGLFRGRRQLLMEYGLATENRV